MRITTQLLLILCVASMVTACNFSSQHVEHGRVAVLDLERVAKETGYSQQIKQQLDNLRGDLVGQLTKVKNNLNTQLAGKQNTFGKKPNNKQKAALNDLFNQAKSKLQQAQQQAENLFQKQRSSLLTQLFDLIRPYAKKVANSRGYDVVVLKNDALVFDSSPEVDITDEVISKVIDAKVMPKPKKDSDKKTSDKAKPDQKNNNTPEKAEG